VLVDETRVGVNKMLHLWRQTLESNGFRLGSSKIEYMRYEICSVGYKDKEVSLEGQIGRSKDTFLYLRSMLQNNGDIDEDVCHMMWY
jgi:hypothetical protein